MVQASGACQWYGSLVTMDKDWTWNDLYYSRAPTLLTSILSWTQETIFLQLTHSLNSNEKLYWRRVTLFHDMDLYWPKMYLCTFQDLLWGIWMTSIGRKCICVFARICFGVFEWPLFAESVFVYLSGFVRSFWVTSIGAAFSAADKCALRPRRDFSTHTPIIAQKQKLKTWK